MITSEASKGLAIRPTGPGRGFRLSGTGIDEVSLGAREAELATGQSITVGSGQPDSTVTRGSASVSASNSPLLSAIEAIQGGRLTPPSEVGFLLTQAVAARESRRGEDITAWSQRLADEAARADS